MKRMAPVRVVDKRLEQRNRPAVADRSERPDRGRPELGIVEDGGERFQSPGITDLAEGGDGFEPDLEDLVAQRRRQRLAGFADPQVAECLRCGLADLGRGVLEARDERAVDGGTGNTVEHPDGYVPQTQVQQAAPASTAISRARREPHDRVVALEPLDEARVAAACGGEQTACHPENGTSSHRGVLRNQ